MIQRRFAVLDRDGTIIREKHYLSDPDEVELIPGVIEGLHILRDMDVGLVVVTNQSGIGRGYFDGKRLNEIHERMVGLLAQEGIRLDGIYHCPHLPTENCACRKPEPGMVLRAAADLKFNPKKCFVIGDKPCDIELGRRCGATTILVATGHGNEYVNDPSVGADYVVADLCAAAEAMRARLTQTALSARLRMVRWRAHVAQLRAEAGEHAGEFASALSLHYAPLFVRKNNDDSRQDARLFVPEDNDDLLEDETIMEPEEYRR